MLLCNFTDQGIRTIKELPSRRAASREMAKKLGVEIKAGYLAMGLYDVVLHIEAADDVAIAKFAMSLGAKGNVRTATVKLIPESEVDGIIAALQ
jgi:uncharacterized protein with GYD domain